MFVAVIGLLSWRALRFMVFLSLLNQWRDERSMPCMASAAFSIPASYPGASGFESGYGVYGVIWEHTYPYEQ